MKSAEQLIISRMTWYRLKLWCTTNKNFSSPPKLPWKLNNFNVTINYCQSCQELQVCMFKLFPTNTFFLSFTPAILADFMTGVRCYSGHRVCGTWGKVGVALVNGATGGVTQWQVTTPLTHANELNDGREELSAGVNESSGAAQRLGRDGERLEPQATPDKSKPTHSHRISRG